MKRHHFPYSGSDRVFLPSTLRKISYSGHLLFGQGRLVSSSPAGEPGRQTAQAIQSQSGFTYAWPKPRPKRVRCPGRAGSQAAWRQELCQTQGCLLGLNAQIRGALEVCFLKEIFFGCTMYHMGSQFLDHGLNSRPLHWKQSLNHWTARRILYQLSHQESP
ncbi:hypothetical protein R6Z07F_019670 [Ovis aries]